MNHLEALWQALDMSRCALAGKTDLTALVQQVNVGELLKLQGDWHRPVWPRRPFRWWMMCGT